MKKLFKALLAGLLITGNTNLVLAEETPSEETILEIHEIDPDSLNVPMLGEMAELPETEAETEPYSLTDTVRASIVLSEPSTMDAGFSIENIAENQAAVSYRSQLKVKQDEITAAINRILDKPIEVKWNLTLLTNIISANVRYGDIEKIKRVNGVEDVFIEQKFEALEEEINTAKTSEYMVGATGAWADGYTGAGTRIAIVDTGIDTSHQSFNSSAFDYSIQQLKDQGKTVNLMTSSELSSLKSQLNGSRGVYVSSKIPFGYNYVDNSTTITHLNDTEGEHGSHVAGIAAANRYIRSGNSYVDAADAVKAVGMAPDAQLFVMKVFGSNGGANESDYMSAIEDAIVLKCDTVNLSLGSANPGFTFSSSYQTVMNNLSNGSANPKLVVTISAGNNGPFTENTATDLYIENVGMHTGGNPGSFINSLCTASVDNIAMTGTPLKFNGSQSVYFTETSSSGAAMATIAGTYNYVYIDGIGDTSEYSAVNNKVSLNGKIVIVNRGELSFYEKGNNLKSYSPKGLVVANNAAGTINMALDDYTGTFPMVSITKADAEIIKSNSSVGTAGSYTYYTGTVTVTNQIISELQKSRENAEVSDFSSWGVPGSLIMKPEIAAPGGNIYSVFGTNKTESGSTAGGSDQYELMSGTSMAAPHMAGLSAVLAQAMKEKGTAVSGYTSRAVNQSLLMSTATPMINNGEYVSILQQGAGLVDVSKAVNATSVIMMGTNDNTLTALTGAAADGKVKAEIGDNPTRENNYTYSFTIHNLNDQDVEYSLDTKLFTQDHYTEDGNAFMSPATTAIEGWHVSYEWEGKTEAGYDVNKDGSTNDADVNAILEYTAKNAAGAAFEIDEAAADMDTDGKVTTNDAYLLAEWLKEGQAEETGALIVPADSSKTITVTIDPEHTMDDAYPCGYYVEGYTYIKALTMTDDGAYIDSEHSIPILGFYGSWTDPSMFDNTSYVDTVYGTAKTPYSGVSDTNYMTIGSSSTRFTGNPYMVEKTFPADRLAIKSSAYIYTIRYNLVRSAGTTGFALTKTDGINGNVTQVLNSSVSSNNVIGLWYYAQSAAWQNTSAKSYSVSKRPSSYSLKEGDTFRVGFYAIPEYNALIVNRSTAASAGRLTSTTFNTVLLSNVLGKGAYIGYDFTVDDTAPVIEEVAKSGNSIRVKVSDNINVAYVSIRSSNGSTVYAETAPGTSEFNDYLEASSIPSNAVVFVSDYAGNTASVSANTSSSSEVMENDEDTADEISISDEVNDRDTQIEKSEQPVMDEEQNVIADGSLNSLRGYRTVAYETEAVTGTENAVSISLYERNEITHNGLYKVAYDSNILTYAKTVSNAVYSYVYETADAVYAAFADVKGFTSEEKIAEVAFSTSEQETKVEITTVESNDSAEIEKPAETVVIGNNRYRISSHSLNLEGKIGVNFFMSVPEDEEDHIKAIVTFNNTTTEKLLSGYPRHYADAEKTVKLRVITVDVAAAQLRDTISIKLVNTETDETVTLYSDGEAAQNNVHEYRALDYMNYMRSATDKESLKTLVNALDNYGKYAQYVFSYNTDNLDSEPDGNAIKDITAETLKPYEMIPEGSITGLRHKKNSLALNSDTSFRVYYETEEGHAVSEYMFYIDGTRAAVRGNASAGYAIMVGNIPSALLDTEHEFEAVPKEGTGSIRMTGSALSYLYDVVSSENSTEAQKNVAKALYNYNQAANAYFGK